MKRISIGLFLTFIGLMIFSACQENVYMDWKVANDQWYEKHKSDEGFLATSTGILYKVYSPGWDYSRQPNSGSDVRVSYTGSLIDGTTFDSSTDTWIGLSSAIAGWKEIIPKMRTGARFKMYIPSKMAYDTVTTNTSIPPHSVLIFDVTLLGSSN